MAFFAEGFVPVDQAHANCEAAATYQQKGVTHAATTYILSPDTAESLTSNEFLAIVLLQLIYLILHVLLVRLQRQW